MKTLYIYAVAVLLLATPSAGCESRDRGRPAVSDRPDSTVTTGSGGLRMRRDSAGSNSTTVGSGTADSLTMNQAIRTLDTYLRFKTENYEPKDQHMFDNLFSCWDARYPTHRRWLADYRILDAHFTNNDTVSVSAEVVTVADQGESTLKANAFVVTPRISVDTLHWPVVRNTESGSMVVCGYSQEGVRFGSYGLPSNTSYEGGASRARLLEQVDSIQKARRR